MSALHQLLGVLPVDSFLWSAPSGTVSRRELPHSIPYSVLGNPRARTTQRGYIKVGSPQANTGQLQRNIPSLELPRLALYSRFTLPTQPTPAFFLFLPGMLVNPKLHAQLSPNLLPGETCSRLYLSIFNLSQAPWATMNF